VVREAPSLKIDNKCSVFLLTLGGFASVLAVSGARDGANCSSSIGKYHVFTTVEGYFFALGCHNQKALDESSVEVIALALIEKAQLFDIDDESGINQSLQGAGHRVYRAFGHRSGVTQGTTWRLWRR
jgi:hypothetical protein